jgi:hypothetical protein
MRAFELIRDIPMLSRGSVFVYDEHNQSRLGSPGCGCLILAWEAGMCQSNWCGATYILPGQCARDETWFVEVDNPQIETVRGLGPKYHVSITKHTYVTVQ